LSFSAFFKVFIYSIGSFFKKFRVQNEIFSGKNKQAFINARTMKPALKQVGKFEGGFRRSHDADE